MTMQHYQALQKTSAEQHEFLGAVLPELRASCLVIKNETLSVEALKATISSHKFSDSWILYRDTLEINATHPDRTDLIEGELTDGRTTLKFALLGSDQYRVITLSTDADAENKRQCAYKKTRVQLNKRAVHQLTDQGCLHAEYAIFYTQDEGAHGGRWRPLTQQFLGFRTAKEATK